MARTTASLAAKIAAIETPALGETPVGATTLRISAPNLKTATFRAVGDSPYMSARFSEKTLEAIRAKHEAGSPKGKKDRSPRDFDQNYKDAQYVSTEGWIGIPAGAFRTAMIDCCRLVNFKMTFAKLSVFIVADGFDKFNGKPLVRIYGEPEMNVDGVRNDSGVLDLRARPMWRKWHVDLKVRYDADQFTLADVTNLLSRVGQQCGIGEGRPNSRDSCGIGFGLFTLASGPQAV